MAQNYEVFFLQETHPQIEIDTINNEWQGRHYRAYGSYHSMGGSKFPDTIGEAHICSDYEGHTSQIPINVNDSDIQLLNVYAPDVLKVYQNTSKVTPCLSWEVTGTVLRTSY